MVLQGRARQTAEHGQAAAAAAATDFFAPGMRHCIEQQHGPTGAAVASSWGICPRQDGFPPQNKRRHSCRLLAVLDTWPDAGVVVVDDGPLKQDKKKHAFIPDQVLASLLLKRDHMDVPASGTAPAPCVFVCVSRGGRVPNRVSPDIRHGQWRFQMPCGKPAQNAKLACGWVAEHGLWAATAIVPGRDDGWPAAYSF